MAPVRAERPHDVALPPPDPAGAGSGDGPVPGCPFCPGAEHTTPPEIWADRPRGGDRDGAGWRVRVFPNLYPVMPADEGVHEVVVSTPRHVESLGDLAVADVAVAVDAWAMRLRAVTADPRGLWPFAFLNQGLLGGASLRHSHAQVVGLPLAPPLLVERARGFARAERCPVCADLADAGDRLVASHDGLVAWCPAVPALSGAVRIAPAHHASEWPHAPGAALAPLLRDLLAATAMTPSRAANVWVNTAPPGGMERYHWHVEVVPRIGTLAGLELGAGVLALTRDPAEAAADLRARLAAAVSPGAARDGGGRPAG